MSVTIRRAKPSQARRLTELAHAAKAHWRYPSRWIRLWRADLTVTPASIRSDPVFYARRGRRIAGFYALSREGPEFELEHFWVDPDEMGAGVGAKLFRHALARIKSAGGRTLRIASDPNAEGFYRRMGARRVGRVASTPKGRTLPLLSMRVSPSPGASRPGRLAKRASHSVGSARMRTHNVRSHPLPKGERC